MFRISYLKFKFNDWKYEYKAKKQRKKKGFADCDCWGMNSWLSETFSKMILTLRNMKHGAPELPFEEIETFPIEWIEPEIEKLKLIREKEKHEYFDLYSIFDRWYLVLTRIAYCLEQADEWLIEIKNEYEEEYMNQVWGEEKDLTKHFVPTEYDNKGKPKLYQLVTNEPDEDLKEKYYNREKEIMDYRISMKDEAFDLIKKYFYNLWD